MLQQLGVVPALGQASKYPALHIGAEKWNLILFSEWLVWSIGHFKQGKNASPR
jgi:hypothetical protein